MVIGGLALQRLKTEHYVFGTRGADRTTGMVDYAMSPVIFGSAEDLWSDFQRGIAEFVNSNGGEAEVILHKSARHDWP